MNVLQFNRTYELIIGEVGSGKGLRIEGNEKEGTGLQISFWIKKSVNNKKSSNTCEINLYNLSEDSVNYLQKPESAVILNVGWDGVNKTLFRGIIKEVETNGKTGRLDRLTTLECIPGEGIIYKSDISKTFPSGSTPRDVIEYLIEETSTIEKASFNSERLSEVMAFGYTAEGTVKSIISDLAHAYDFYYQIDDHKIFVSDFDKFQSPNSVQRAFVITAETGLIGTPSFVADKGEMQKEDPERFDGVKFKALLNPSIKPGMAVSLKSSIVTGIYRVDNVDYAGDWRGGEWNINCTCSKINAREV